MTDIWGLPVARTTYRLQRPAPPPLPRPGEAGRNLHRTAVRRTLSPAQDRAAGVAAARPLLRRGADHRGRIFRRQDMLTRRREGLASITGGGATSAGA